VEAPVIFCGVQGFEGGSVAVSSRAIAPRFPPILHGGTGPPLVTAAALIMVFVVVAKACRWPKHMEDRKEEVMRCDYVELVGGLAGAPRRTTERARKKIGLDGSLFTSMWCSVLRP
jgi:hypothetical protein